MTEKKDIFALMGLNLIIRRLILMMIEKNNKHRGTLNE